MVTGAEKARGCVPHGRQASAEKLAASFGRPVRCLTILSVTRRRYISCARGRGYFRAALHVEMDRPWKS